ncbi:hypothetical protein ACFT25_13320 [Streptomyces hydrogenans]
MPAQSAPERTALCAAGFTVHTDDGDVVLDLHPDQPGPSGSRHPTA